MGEAPHDPPPAAFGDGDSPGAPSAADRPVAAVEHFGPLNVRRVVKVDGRGLILYERADAST